jgi:hypothetical protein
MPIIAGVAVLIVILLAVALKMVVVPRMFVSVETLCERGEYEKAYKKAKDDEKLQVVGENVAAYLSNETSDSLKDPTSFSLRAAWFSCIYDVDDEKVRARVVLYVSGKNSYGGTVSNYWIYSYDESSGEFSLTGTSSSLYPDEDDDDYYDGLFARVLVESDHTIELDKSSIKNINALFEKDALDQVEIPEVDELDISLMPREDDDSDN